MHSPARRSVRVVADSRRAGDRRNVPGGTFEQLFLIPLIRDADTCRGGNESSTASNAAPHGSDGQQSTPHPDARPSADGGVRQRQSAVSRILLRGPLGGHRSGLLLGRSPVPLPSVRPEMPLRAGCTGRLLLLSVCAVFARNPPGEPIGPLGRAPRDTLGLPRNASLPGPRPCRAVGDAGPALCNRSTRNDPVLHMVEMMAHTRVETL